VTHGGTDDGGQISGGTSPYGTVAFSCLASRWGASYVCKCLVWNLKLPPDGAGLAICLLVVVVAEGRGGILP